MEVSDSTWWKIREKAASERMEESEWIKNIIQDLLGIEDIGTTPSREEYENFEEYVVDCWRGKGLTDRARVRKENVANVLKIMKEEYSKTNEAPSASRAFKICAEDKRKKTAKKLSPDYRNTVESQCVRELGFSGVNEFEQEAFELIKSWLNQS